MGDHDGVLRACWRGDGEEWRAKRRKRTVKTAGANGELRGVGAALPVGVAHAEEEALAPLVRLRVAGRVWLEGQLGEAAVAVAALGDLVDAKLDDALLAHVRVRGAGMKGY